MFAKNFKLLIMSNWETVKFYKKKTFSSKNKLNSADTDEWNHVNLWQNTKLHRGYYFFVNL